MLFITPFLRKFIPGRACLTTFLKTAFFEEVPKTTSTGKQSVQTETVPRPTPLWTAAHYDALLRICTSITDNAIFGVDHSRQIHLATDASVTGIGAIMFQLADKHPAGTEYADKLFDDVEINMFISFAFTGGECRYTVPEKETLAVIKTLAECRWLIMDSPHPVKVYTDHLALVQSMAAKGEIHGKVSRWLEKLTEYTVEFHHRGNRTKAIAIADGLSRLTSDRAPPFREDSDGLDWNARDIPREPSALPPHTTGNPPYNNSRKPNLVGGDEALSLLPRVDGPDALGPNALAMTTKAEMGSKQAKSTILLPMGAPWGQSLATGQAAQICAAMGNEDLGLTLRFLLEGNDALTGVSRHTRRKVKTMAFRFVVKDGTTFPPGKRWVDVAIHRQPGESRADTGVGSRRTRTLRPYHHPRKGTRLRMVADQDERHRRALQEMLHMPTDRTARAARATPTDYRVQTDGHVRHGLHGPHKSPFFGGLPIRATRHGLLHQIRGAPAVHDCLGPGGDRRMDLPMGPNTGMAGAVVLRQRQPFYEPIGERRAGIPRRGVQVRAGVASTVNGTARETCPSAEAADDEVGDIPEGDTTWESGRAPCPTWWSTSIADTCRS